MRIEELTPDQKITFLIVYKEEQLEFESTVIEALPRKHVILATPVVKEDKVIAFRGKGILVHLIVTFPDQKPIVFQNVTVLTTKREDDSICYSISTLAESKEYNRRQAFRCYIGINCVVQVGASRSSYDAIVKDLSASGFAFTMTRTEKDFEIGELAHTVLNDYIMETAENFSFQLYGIIARKYEVDNGRIVYGCRLVNKVIGIEKYINVKQRQQLRKHSS